MRLEYFNQWYSLRSYYTCVTLMDLPLQVLYNIILCILIIRVKLCTVIHFNKKVNLERKIIMYIAVYILYTYYN